MKSGYLIISFFVAASLLMQHAFPQNQFDKYIFYTVIAGKNVIEIEKQITLVRSSGLPEKQAYEGALLAKKAGLVVKAKEKLNLFKEGRKKLEEAIRNDSNNTEFRFLRLMIQEHSPKSLNYKKEIVTDSEFIRKNFKTLSAAMQKVVVDYSRKSTVLKPADF